MMNTRYLNGLDETLLSGAGLPNGTPTISYPFLSNGDRETKIIRQKYWLFAEALSSAAIDSQMDAATAALFPFETASMILCEETDAAEVGCGIVEVERMFCDIPKMRTVRTPQSITTFGFNSQPTWAAISDYSVSVVRDFHKSNPPYEFYFAFPATYEGRDVCVSAQLKFEDQFGGGGTSTLKATKYGIVENGAFSFTWYPGNNRNYASSVSSVQISTAPKKRNSKSIVADGYDVYSYVLLSNPAQKVEVSSAFEELSGANILTATTSPSATEFAKMISDGVAYQCAEAAVNQWHGNIYEIRTPYVYAI